MRMRNHLKGQLGLFPCNFALQSHCEGLMAILDAYMKDPMGAAPSLGARRRASVLAHLRDHPRCLVLLATLDTRPVGAAVCFINYSTFAAAPFVNIHDLAVLPSFRGAGIGAALLLGVELHARKQGCARMTLEVRADNEIALSLYRRARFKHCAPPMFYLRRELPRSVDAQIRQTRHSG
jgi:ribosomal protein S18 acetylase RimI-like enzyme